MAKSLGIVVPDGGYATMHVSASCEKEIAMPSISRVHRSFLLMESNAIDRFLHSTKWFRNRRNLRLDNPPATNVVAEKLTDGVFEIRLDGGARRNVLGRSTIDRIEHLVFEPPKGTRVIVITASPPDFCAGYDLVEAARGAPEQLIANEKNFAPLRTSTLPIIVALQGNVIGGGLELALSADIRLASPETKFSIPASKLGLVYSETGIRLVVTALGDSFARALFLAGQDVSAESALSMGLVTEIVGRDQLRERALKLASSIASWSLLATSGNRQILDSVAGRISIDTDALHRKSFAPGSDMIESIERFVARRSRPAGERTNQQNRFAGVWSRN